MKLNAFNKPKGWIEVICGPMFAGKSEELLRRVNLEVKKLNLEMVELTIVLKLKILLTSLNI